MAKYVKILPDHLRHPRSDGETCDGFDYFEVNCYSADETLAEVRRWIRHLPGYWAVLHLYNDPVWQPLGRQMFSVAITDPNVALEFRLRWGGTREREKR